MQQISLEMIYTITGKIDKYSITISNFYGSFDEALAEFRRQFPNFIITNISGYPNHDDEVIPF